VAPLAVTFTVVGRPAPATFEVDFDGNGTADFTGASLTGQVFTYTQPGLYIPRVAIVDAQGRRLSVSTVVQVYDLTTLDAMLQAKWTALKEALRAGDIAGAAALIHSDTRDAYQTQFARFRPATLANIDQYATTIQLVEFGPGGAQYEMLRVGNSGVVSFAVWFQVDEDGLWRLRRF
jgi:hypothetical protein